jgi:hypothetical protein
MTKKYKEQVIMQKKDVVELIRKTLVNAYGDSLSEGDTDLEISKAVYRNLHRHFCLNSIFYNRNGLPTIYK